GAPRMSRSSRYSVMSRVPTGRAAPSMAAILAARRWARVTPRVRRPTKARSLAPPLRSRISCALRVRARSTAASSRTCVCSRRRDLLVIFSPYEPLRAHLKERAEPRVTLPGSPRSCQRLVASGQQRHELVEVDGLGHVGVEARLDGLAHVLGLAVARQGDEARGRQRRVTAQPPGHFQAVDV